MNKNNTTVKWRAYLVLTTIILFALILIIRLYFVQIVKAEYYIQKADRQHSVPSSEIFNRGTIFYTKRDGSFISGGSLKKGYTLALNPSLIVNPESVYNNLSIHLKIDPDDFLKKIENKSSKYVEFFNRLDEDVVKKIAKMDLIGVTLHPEKWRYYPGNELASHITGFVSYKGDELRGQYGLERQYEEILNRNGDNIFNNFFVEIFSNIKSVIRDGEDMKGSIVTTIEPSVQTFLEEELKNVHDDYSAKMVGGIIMNPQDGAIYGMGLYPNFDLNKFGAVDDSDIYQNHLVESVYEMGSIIKPLTVAIGLDQKKITPESTYNDLGSKTLDGYTFYNYDKRARGITDMQGVLNQSLNVGVSHIVDLVGNQIFGEYLEKLFGGLTEIDLPNEQSALMGNLQSKKNIEYATASFGQGIAMTPIAIIRGLAALGNGGYLVQPHLVSKIDYRTGFSKKMHYPKGEQIFSNETSETISRMLINTVDVALKNGAVALSNHSIAAKTGTAQIAKTNGSGYYVDRYLHSFFGYFPAYDPEFIIFLYIVEPENVQYASETLTDPFMNLTKFLINYYEVAPDRANNEKIIKLEE